MSDQEVMKKRGRSFETIAEQYDTFRPSYPPAMIDFILSKSGISHPGRILEIGSGTGKATLPFAQRGYCVQCIEPGESMAEVARRKLKQYPGIQFSITSFEEWKGPEEHFDLVISGQAFHWIDPQIGYFKVHRLLKPGGWMALFWNMADENWEPVDDDVRRVYREYAPTLTEDLPGTYESISKREGEIRASGFFDEITLERFPWSASYTTDEYLGQQSTKSDHIILSDEERSRLLAALAEVIDQNGGFIVRHSFAMLYMGRKVGG
jgi:SAM-dependent methyltransferase